jgi:DNA modification methylase
MRVETFGDATLINGDCREVLKGPLDFIFVDPPYGHLNNDGDLISFREAALGQKKDKGEATIDFLFADPPYGQNFGDERNILSRHEHAKGFKTKDEEAETRPILNDSPEETKALIDWLFNEATKFLVKGGVISCCCSGGGGKDVAMAEWPQQMFAVPHLQFKQIIIWDKGPMGMGWQWRRSYEVILEAQRKGASTKWYDKTRKVENIIRPGDYGIYKIIPEKDQHPTEKPPELAALFIKLHTRPGELVVDPFMGAGSTGVAAIRTGRKFLGIELDPHWYDVACKKIEAEVKEKESGDDLMDALGFD